ncbi:MAG: F0F1 ATP synthase subunit delta [Alphaproteobacteria bacterium]|nr:F0F1 ATP synthase subunit delta [Alphaproteobacteria bacterium]
MVAETTIVSGIAGRYATALFELAVEQKALDRAADDFGKLARAIAESADFRRVLRSPVLSRADQQRAVIAVIERMDVADLTRRFVALLAQNRRLFALSDIMRDFNALRARHRGEQAGQLISAHPLADDQLNAVRRQLAAMLGSEVRLSTKVDPSLLGGLIVQVGSRMLDASLKTKLQRLKISMKGAG